MRTFSGLVSAMTTAAVSLVLCCAVFADAPQMMRLTIENHQKLVTVKDGSGAWLFAQVLSAPNLKLSQVSLGKDRSRIRLQDASGKMLWSKLLDYGISNVSIEGGWVDASNAVYNQAFKSLGAIDLGSIKSSPQPTQLNATEFIIGSEDQLVSSQFVLGRHHFRIMMLKSGFAAKMDGNNVLVVLPQPVSSQPASSQAVPFNVQDSAY